MVQGEALKHANVVIMSQSLLADVVTPIRIRLITFISDTRGMAVVVLGFSIVGIVVAFGIVVNGKVVIACLTPQPARQRSRGHTTRREPHVSCLRGRVPRAVLTVVVQRIIYDGCVQADFVVAKILVGIVP